MPFAVTEILQIKNLLTSNSTTSGRLRTESSLADFPRGRVQYKTTRDVRAWGVKGYLRNLMKTSHTIYLACGLAVLGVCAGAQTPKTHFPAAESRPAPKGAFAKEIGDLEARYDRADWKSPELILQGASLR